jgi:hypothetical protein
MNSILNIDGRALLTDEGTAKVDGVYSSLDPFVESDRYLQKRTSVKVTDALHDNPAVMNGQKVAKTYGKYVANLDYYAVSRMMEYWHPIKVEDFYTQLALEDKLPIRGRNG